MLDETLNHSILVIWECSIVQREDFNSEEKDWGLTLNQNVPSRYTTYP